MLAPQWIMRLAQGGTLALAVCGAKAEVRERETQEAQAPLIDISNDPSRQEIIRLPSDEDELIE